MLVIVNFAHCRPLFDMNRVATSLFIHHLKNSSYTNIIHGASFKAIELLSLNHLLAVFICLKHSEWTFNNMTESCEEIDELNANPYSLSTLSISIS